MSVPSPDKWGGVRKKIANYLTILLKYLMDQYNKISSDMVLERLPPADVAPSKRKHLRFTTTIHNIGTWNVRGMNIGKLEIIKQEMQRLHIDLLGISELYWTGNGFFKSDEYTVVYCGNDTIKRNGVAFIATKAVNKAVYSFNIASDRIISITITGSLRSITVLQAYAPTADAPEKDIEDIYTKLQETID
ncbi:hypothetical protein HELRODRAFT_164090 [Helobdella robusta]|uniref:Endonuclease/exonuclease/phosphatase domain-containing protein n=1 Tax=Helobdella robusta TaxID=6412 RepID=T1EUW9_HELRO|nr:hypothetical protein HELRODRAFT_164090 [Helobdella robusta]ESN94279.1 hypothetical protein HELRODRAFT_164090 [Helobdella robusta]